MKKKLFPLALLVLVSGAVSGCPVYDDDAEGCFDDYDCSVGYYCDYSSGACLREGSSASCDEPNDCAANETCSKSGVCAAGDCHFASVGCVSGFECSGRSGRWECVREGSTSGGGGSASSGGAMSGGAPVGGDGAGAPGSSAGEAGAPPAGGAPSEPPATGGAAGAAGDGAAI